MKITSLLVNVRDFGGAGSASVHLLNSLIDEGIQAKMLVYFKRTHNQNILRFHDVKQNKVSKLFTRLVMCFLTQRSIRRYSERKILYTPSLIPHPIHNVINSMNPDIVHLHWTSNFVPISSIPKIAIPIIWTLHDMWAMTGGCHITKGCSKYLEECGACPQLRSKRKNDISTMAFRQKLKYWEDVPFHLVVPSQVMFDYAHQSPILRNKSIHIIPNIIEVDKFRRLNKSFARNVFNFSEENKMILFISKDLSDPNKGLNLLIQALQILSIKENVELILVGDDAPSYIKDISIPIHKMGSVHDSRILNLLYAASDTSVVASLQESFGLVAAESLACGTPCVVFRTSGLIDIVDHEINGYIAEPFDVESLAHGIEWILTHPNPLELSEAARNKVVQNFSPSVVSRKYVELYTHVIQENKTIQ